MAKLILKSIEGEFGTSLMDMDLSEGGFFVNIELEIGEQGKNGSEVFSFNICDEKGLLRTIWQDPEFKDKEITSLSGYNVFVMKKYDLESLLRYIEGILNSVPEGISWKQKGLLLSRYFYWEYLSETIEKF
jgi:hypothetical protein